MYEILGNNSLSFINNSTFSDFSIISLQIKCNYNTW